MQGELASVQETSRVVSGGVLLLCEPGMVFLAHVTGASHWDIPKGAREKGETCLEAAVRETAEETGLHLLPQCLTELGAFS